MGGFRHVPGCTVEHLGLPCSALLGSQNTGVLVQRGNYVTDVAPFAALAAKERVNVTDIAGSEWFVVKSEKAKGSRKHPRVLGFAGVASVARNKARIRAVWVRPDFRGEGIGEALSQACLEYGIAAHALDVLAELGVTGAAVATNIGRGTGVPSSDQAGSVSRSPRSRGSPSRPCASRTLSRLRQSRRTHGLRIRLACRVRIRARPQR